jgi:hypothetical protein
MQFAPSSSADQHLMMAAAAGFLARNDVDFPFDHSFQAQKDLMSAQSLIDGRVPRLLT